MLRPKPASNVTNWITVESLCLQALGGTQADLRPPFAFIFFDANGGHGTAKQMLQRIALFELAYRTNYGEIPADLRASRDDMVDMRNTLLGLGETVWSRALEQSPWLATVRWVQTRG